MTLSIGVVGAGVVSQYHIETLCQCEQATVAAVADPAEEVRKETAARHGIARTYADYREMLDDAGIDVVYVCAPNWLHREMAMNALALGKHVICEKPLAMNAAEADEMISAARKMNRKLCGAENHRYLPENRKATAILHEGGIGRPFLSTSCFIGNEFERMSDREHWKGTREKSGGGVIIDNGPHVFDTVINWLGEVKFVSATGKRLLVPTDNKEEDTGIVLLEFDSGVIAEVTLTFSARYCGFPQEYRGAGVRCDVYGEKGALHLSLGDDFPLVVVDKHGRRGLRRTEMEREYGLDMDEHFVECIRRNREPLVTAWDGRQVLAVIDAAYESIRTGRRIELGADSGGGGCVN